MARETVTLNVEESCLRLMVLRKKQVRLAISQPLEPGLVRNGTIVDRIKLSQAIGDLFQRNRIKSKRVIVSIGGNGAFYRLISQPPVPSSMHAEAAKREAERLMPVSPSQLHLSYQVMPVSKTESMMSIVGLSRGASEGQVETLKMAGLAPYIMDIKPLAMARAVNEPEAILVDVQEGTFDIVLVTGGLPQIVRSMSFPSPSLPFAEKVEVVAQELDRTVKFHSSTRKDNALGATAPLFISGEIDRTGEEILSQRLGYATRPLPEPALALNGLDRRRYLVNLGLALKVSRRKDRLMGMNMNVLPELYRPKRRSLARIFAVALLPVGVAALVWANSWLGAAKADSRAVEKRLIEIERQVQMRQTQVAEVGTLEAKVAALAPLAADWEKVLANLHQSRMQASIEPGRALKLAGQSIRLISVEYTDGGSMTVTGAAPTKGDVLYYAERLRDSRTYPQTLVQSLREVPAGVEFTLELK